MRRILMLAAALIFLLFAYWNLNDPDAFLWVATYGVLALLFILALVGRVQRRIVLAVAVVLTLWMLTMLPGMVDWVRMGMPSITGSMQADAPHIEVVREFLGLLIAVVGLFGLSVTTSE